MAKLVDHDESRRCEGCGRRVPKRKQNGWGWSGRSRKYLCTTRKSSAAVMAAWCPTCTVRLHFYDNPKERELLAMRQGLITRKGAVNRGT